MRPVCLRCRRPQATCYCAHIPRVETRTRVVFLQHPRERRVAIGTARMAHLALSNSELHQGVDFSDNPRLAALAAAPERVAVLFPGQEAMTLEEARARPPEALIVVDGTWPLAKKVVSVNPVLAGLPRIGFTPRRPSNYRIRSEPAEHCVSTIEAVVEVLGALEGDQPRFDAMLRAFEFMVDTQLENQSSRQEPPRRRIYKAPWRPPLELRSLAERFPRLVLLYAEANAHPMDAGIAPELVHLVASRPSTGERFEAVLAPREPLARSTPLHTELPGHVLLAGEDRGAALARFEAFLRPDDVLAVWTSYALELLWRDGVSRRQAVNVRLAAARALAGKAGGVEQAVAMLGAEAPALWAQGRAGRRIQALEAVAQALILRGQATQPPLKRQGA
ncbi:tRNA-uridine aminocarboxypropyltransferase [Stigmatella erecta]|uniref:tRNA-uridine aminocarboxypropyltransferase n=1 Tax=Stigmatella erecta TaxID=83460 RepID=A0A1I0L729_9BACT|nr:tRNA-uridine aminocarboxypropyltransferase [Stigmatella erecta]SEU35544.1 DTW domain-containing protein YfiP [Stigmatella erecta]